MLQPIAQEVLDAAIQIVEAHADDSWLEWCSVLMPSFVARVNEARLLLERREQEEREREAEAQRERDLQARRAAEALERERLRQRREVEDDGLSPSTGRVAARKTSRSTIGDGEESPSKSTPRPRRDRRFVEWPLAADDTHQNPAFSAYDGAQLVS